MRARTPSSRSMFAVASPPAPPGRRIGLMGGSFDPPHAGHVGVTQAALRRLRLDSVWWLVTPGNPLKRRDGLPPVAERIAAARRLVRDPRVVVTGLEAELGSAFTADTIAFLRRRFRAARFVLVIGADNFANFHRWRAWREIAAAVPIAVVDRPGWRLRALASPAARAFARNRIAEPLAATLAQRRPPAWCFLTVRLSPLASSSIRNASKNKPLP